MVHINVSVLSWINFHCVSCLILLSGSQIQMRISIYWGTLKKIPMSGSYPRDSHLICLGRRLTSIIFFEVPGDPNMQPALKTSHLNSYFGRQREAVNYQELLIGWIFYSDIPGVLLINFHLTTYQITVLTSFLWTILVDAPHSQH